MGKVTKVNYECAKQALNELKRNPSNLQAYQLAELMAEKEAFNIKNWESQIFKWNEINTRLVLGVDYLENQFVLSSKFLEKCLTGFNILLDQRAKLDPFIKEYQEYLELFTAYRAFSPPQKIVTEQKSLELITP